MGGQVVSNNGADNQCVPQLMDFATVLIANEQPIFLAQGYVPDFILNIISIYFCHAMPQISNQPRPLL